MMRSYMSIVTLCCLCVCTVSTQSGARASKAPPGSFVTKIVTSAGELADLVRSDKATANRLSRHFGMAPDDLAQYFDTHLKQTTLSAPGAYTIYYISRRGRIAARTDRLPAGEKVFAAHDGTPIILVRCGNPMVRRLPPPPAVRRVPPPVPTVPSLKGAVESRVIPVEVEALPAVSLASEPIVPEVHTMVLSHGPTVFQSLAWFAPALVGAVTVRSSKAVPEPSGLLVAAVGLSGLAVRRFRSK